MLTIETLAARAARIIGEEVANLVASGEVDLSGVHWPLIVERDADEAYTGDEIADAYIDGVLDLLEVVCDLVGVEPPRYLIIEHGGENGNEGD